MAELLASTYHELREGISSYGHRIDTPAAVMSTAEAVSVYYQTMMTAYYYGDSAMDVGCLVQNLTGAVRKETKMCIRDRGTPLQGAGLDSLYTGRLQRQGEGISKLDGTGCLVCRRRKAERRRAGVPDPADRRERRRG